MAVYQVVFKPLRSMEEVMRWLMVVLAVIFLHGCAKTWYNPYKTREEAQRDLYECDYNSTLYSHAAHGYYNVFTAGINLGDCMRARGYR